MSGAPAAPTSTRRGWRPSLGVRILLGMAAGALLGLLVGEPIGVVKPVGDLFIRLLVMASIPLVFFNLLSGLTSLADARSVGRIGARIALYYVATTVLALGLGLAAMELLQPGRGFALRGETPERFGEMPGVVDVVLGLVPRNAFAAFAEGRVSQVVVFALLLGIAALALPEAQRARLRGIFDVFTAWMRRLVELILLAAPVGIGALAAVTVGAHGADLFGPVARFVGGVWAAQAVLLGVYLLLLVALARRRPVEFLRQGMPVFLTAAATASSLATLPVSLDTAEKRLGLPRSVIGFTLPLGAQVNKDGTALFLTAILMFTAQAAGAEFTLAQHFSILLVGLLLSEGSNGIPGGGLIIAFIFVEAFHLPVEIVAVVAGIFHLLDVTNTTLNCTSDLVGSCIVARFERPPAGAEETP